MHGISFTRGGPPIFFIPVDPEGEKGVIPFIDTAFCFDYIKTLEKKVLIIHDAMNSESGLWKGKKSMMSGIAMTILPPYK